MSDSQVALGKSREASKSVRTQAAARAPVGKKPRSPEEVHQVIAVAAYYLAEGRNFQPGHEMEDWLNAEAQVLAEVESLKGFPA